MRKKILILAIALTLASCFQQTSSVRLDLLPELEKNWATQLTKWYRNWGIPSTKRALNTLKIPKKFEPRRNNLLIEPNLNFSTPKLKKVK